METDNLILEHLRPIRGTLDRHSDELREIKERIGILETGVGNLAAQYASLSTRLDRLDDRVARIERRLDLQDA
jgi:predicted nuclease with TOPRIM domain